MAAAEGNPIKANLKIPALMVFLGARCSHILSSGPRLWSYLAKQWLLLPFHHRDGSQIMKLLFFKMGRKMLRQREEFLTTVAHMSPCALFCPGGLSACLPAFAGVWLHARGVLCVWLLRQISVGEFLTRVNPELHALARG